MTPRAAWRRIDGETAGPTRLFWRYGAVLALGPPLCRGLGRLAFGEVDLPGKLRPSLLGVVIEASLAYGLILVSTFALCLLIWGLAKPFGGVSDRAAGFKLGVYAGTPGWVGSVFYLFPPLSLFVAAAVLYGLYELYVGAKTLIRPAAGRLLPYLALVLAFYIVLQQLEAALVKLLAALL